MTKQELRDRIAELEAANAEKDQKLVELAGEVCRLATMVPSTVYYPQPAISPHWISPGLPTPGFEITFGGGDDLGGAVGGSVACASLN